MEAQLHVVHILNELRLSGAEVMLRIAGGLWEAHGVQAEILTMGEVPGPYAHVLSASGYRIQHIPFSSSVRFIAQLYHYFRSKRFDVVHVHAERASFWVSVAALAAGTPRIVRTVHSAFEFKGLLRVRRGLQRQALRFLGVRTAAISRAVGMIERERFAYPTEVISNWYDAARFRPPSDEARRTARANLGLMDGQFALVSVGNCAAVKNHHALLEALPQLPNNVVYLHVGHEDADLAEQKLAATLGVRDRVRFLGSLEDVAGALYAADLFVLPSLREGFPISMVEAIASGLPVVVTDYAALREFAQHFSGLHYVEPNPVGIASGVFRAMEEAQVLSATRPLRENYDRAARLFAPAQGVKRYVELYRRRGCV